MVLYIVLLAWLSILPHYDVASLPRSRRDATGALQILTNHAQPIHADVKPEGGSEITEKPCPKNKHLPSHIESGVVFQVTPPVDTLVQTYYQAKSLRKSLGQLPSKLELVRSIGRVITMTTLLVSAVLEFYPLLQNLYHTIYTFLYPPLY